METTLNPAREDRLNRACFESPRARPLACRARRRLLYTPCRCRPRRLVDFAPPPDFDPRTKRDKLAERARNSFMTRSTPAETQTTGTRSDPERVRERPRAPAPARERVVGVLAIVTGKRPARGGRDRIEAAGVVDAIAIDHAGLADHYDSSSSALSEKNLDMATKRATSC